MRHLTIHLDTVSAAFTPDPDAELARILEALAQRFRMGVGPVWLRDKDGNRVGRVEYA